MPGESVAAGRSPYGPRRAALSQRQRVALNLLGGHGALQNWVIGAPNHDTIHSSAQAQREPFGVPPLGWADTAGTPLMSEAPLWLW